MEILHNTRSFRSLILDYLIKKDDIKYLQGIGEKMITLSKPLISAVSCCKNWEHLLYVFIVTINLHLIFRKSDFIAYNYQGMLFSTITICMKNIFLHDKRYIHASIDHISGIVGPFKICKPVM